jgi:hypothetical protein
MTRAASRNGKPSRNGHATVQPLATVTGEGRTASGRFGPGNYFGKGNPFCRRMAELRRAAVAEVSVEELRALMRKLYRLALDQSDIPAATLLLSYLIGKPTKAVDPDDLDNDEWRRLRDVPSREEFMVSRMTGIPTAAAIEKMQTLREQFDPFDKSLPPLETRFVDEINAQRRRRK